MLSQWKKSYNQPRQHIKKQRHYFANKGPSSPSFFPVAMYECSSWTIKKYECQRINAFELWCWKRLLRVPWTARRSNQSILKEISPEYSLEGLMLKMKLQYLATWCEELNHMKRPRCWERLKAGGGGDHRGWDGWMASPTQWTCVWINFGSWWWTGRPGVLQSMESQRIGHDWTDWSSLILPGPDLDNDILDSKPESDALIRTGWSLGKLDFVRLRKGRMYCLYRRIKNC